MAACEPCWNEAFRQSRMLGGSQVDYYLALIETLDSHPHDEPSEKPRTRPAARPAARVHNHAPYRPACNERNVDGQLRGACLNDDGSDR